MKDYTFKSFVDLGCGFVAKKLLEKFVLQDENFVAKKMQIDRDKLRLGERL